MHKRAVELFLVSDVVVSATGSTVGGHEALDYLPGAMLLGSAAAQLYKDLTPEESWLVFHSGKLRFLDARPVGTACGAGVPMPLSLYSPKTGQVGQTLSNLIWGGRGQGVQWKQSRGGWLCRTKRGMELVRPTRNYRLKSAIAAGSNMAAAGQLFGYQALARGTRLRAEIHADDDAVPDVLFDKVCAVFNARLSLGRSRSAQYGQVSGQCSANTAETQHGIAPRKGYFVLLLQSDLCLRDEFGFPSLEPLTSRLGLEQGELQRDLCHIRFRRYSPYNVKRCLPDQERQVLAAGSVLVVKRDAPLDKSELDNLNKGIGEYREAGLGQVLVNPDFLMQDTLNLSHPDIAHQAPPPAPAPDSWSGDMLSWLDNRRQGASKHSRRESWAQERYRELKNCLEATQRLYGLAGLLEAAPGATQFGALETLGKERGHALLWSDLFVPNDPADRGQGPLAADESTDWGRFTVWTTAGPDKASCRGPLRDWLKYVLFDAGPLDNPGMHLAQLADVARKQLFSNDKGKRDAG